MKKLLALKTAYIRQEDGATAIEYGLIAALVSVAAIAGFQAMGGSLDTIFTGVSGELDAASTTAGYGAGETPSE